MLNNDDTRPAGPNVSAIVTAERSPSKSPSLTTPSLPAPLDGGQQYSNPQITQDHYSISRKRQRVEDSLSSPSVALPTQPQARDNSGVVNPDISPQQVPKPPPAKSPSSRNNSVIMMNDSKSGLEPSIGNLQPREELTRFISDFIFLNLNEEGVEQLEVPFICHDLAHSRLKQSWAKLLMSIRMNDLDYQFIPRQVRTL